MCAQCHEEALYWWDIAHRPECKRKPAVLVGKWYQAIRERKAEK
jgi:hypothetical protein